MNVNTWQDFIKEANSLARDPAKQVREAVIQVDLPKEQFFDLDHRIDFSDSEVMEDLSEALHDALLESSIYGITEVEFVDNVDTVAVRMHSAGLGNNPATIEPANRVVIENVVHEFLASSGHCISEEKGRMRQHGIYRFGCLIEYEITTGEKARSLDDIVSDMRAIPTVTIVSVVVGNERISEKRYVAGLRVKYIPSYPGNLAQPEEAKAYILRLIKRIKNVRSVSRVTLKTDRVE